MNTPDDKLLDIVRHFPENGMKRLLETPSNVRDLLTLAASDLARRIEFDQMRLERTIFVGADYRHLESDVLLRAPIKGSEDRTHRTRAGKEVTVYILIEHQSQPDRRMPLRLLEYLAQIYKAQERRRSRSHDTRELLELHPVVPVVFYTGTRPWDSPGSLADLVLMADVFDRFIPASEPLFVNLPALSPRVLESRGGFLGRILRLVQERQSPPEAFGRLLRRVLRHLEAMPESERSRWRELLSYIHALVYHQRDASELPVLKEIIARSFARDDLRREVIDMEKSYAQLLQEKGRQEGIQQGLQQGLQKGIEKGLQEGEVEARRKTLLRLLRKRFGGLPEETASKIERAADVDQLDAWIDAVLTASTIDDVGI